MKTITIPQKMSGTGSIHDIASQHTSREIKFPKGCKYAVVLAAYYGGKGYTCHETREATILASNRQKKFSHQILDSDNNRYYCDGYELLIQ